MYGAISFVVAGKHAAAEEVTRDVERLAREDPSVPDAGDLLAITRAHRAYLAELDGREARGAEACREALDALDTGKLALRTSAAYWMGHCHFLRGDLAAAESVWLDYLDAPASRHGERGLARSPRGSRASGRFRDDSPRPRRSPASGCAGWMASAVGVSTSTGNLPIALADVLRELNDLDGALAHAEAGIADNQRLPSPYAVAAGLAVIARVRLARAASTPRSTPCAGSSRSWRAPTSLRTFWAS